MRLPDRHICGLIGEKLISFAQSFLTLLLICHSMRLWTFSAIGPGPVSADEHLYSGKVHRTYKFTNTWAVKISGGPDAAKALAIRHGFRYLGQILPGVYHFQHRRIARRSIQSAPFTQRTLAFEPGVLWLQQQVAKVRVKRGFQFTDPKWPVMWYLNRGGGLDMNVQGAWSMGINGRGVVVTILDDGIERDHPDLMGNYDPYASTDVNENDPDPQPRYDFTRENKHGTRCAGVVAAQANNNICNLGVAFGAKIGGVRMLDGDVTDAVEARSLSHRAQHVDIYSASWGPDDDGKTVDGPGPLTREAFARGVKVGRRGKGSIYVWASGNGGKKDDSCNCDGYTNSIYTVSVSSATEHGSVPWYSEACSSTLATTYSSGSSAERQIVTTDLNHLCTETHTGTSASAPIAAGIVALTLQANPRLTWRDVQHIIVLAARRANLEASDWENNGIGRQVSHHFGFGLMDASKMVELALNWTTVPEQHVCEITSAQADIKIPVNGKHFFHIRSDGCFGKPNFVQYMEHVQAKITLNSSQRGNIEISLVSPAKTTSTLLERRKLDGSHDGFSNWAFMSTHNWGEQSFGTWTLVIRNGASMSILRSWSLVLYGTATQPHSSYNVSHYTVWSPQVIGFKMAANDATDCKLGIDQVVFNLLLHMFCCQLASLLLFCSRKL